MTLAETIDNDLKQAMKAHHASVVETLRMLRASVKNEQIAKQRPLRDEEILALIRTSIKQLKDARSAFESGNRADLVEKNDREIEILSAFLPAALSSEELDAIIQEKVAAIGRDPKLFGKVMGEVVKAVDGRADGATIQSAVKAALDGS